MNLGRSAIATLLNTHVVELKFRRRLQKPGMGPFRRMLCTNDRRLLESVGGKQVLNFTNPTGRLKYNPAAKNLVVAWDIFWQNWRMINCDQVEVIAVIKTSPDATEFWKYFNAAIAPMSGQQKQVFMAQ